MLPCLVGMLCFGDAHADKRFLVHPCLLLLAAPTWLWGRCGRHNSPPASSVSVMDFVFCRSGALISRLTQSIHLFFGLPRFLLPGGTISRIFLQTYSWCRLLTCPNHLNLAFLHLSVMFSCGNFASKLLAIPFTPICQCLSMETLNRRSLLSGVYARGSKVSHQSAIECVTVVDSTTHSNPPPFSPGHYLVLLLLRLLRNTTLLHN